MADDELHEAVDKIIDEDRLLPGEDPETTEPEDAEHWLAAYGELLGFKHRVVGEAKAGSSRLSDDAKDEAGADLTLLQAERERLKRRYEFWKSRLEELRGT